MRLFMVFAVLVLLGTGPAAAAEPPPATAATIMHSAGLDRVFVQFGQSLAVSPRSLGIADERFLEAWESVTSDAFARPALNARLRTMLSRSLVPAELARIENFLHSPFGRRVTELERLALELPPERQIAAVAKGQTLYFDTSETRRAQFEELLELSGAEVTFAMVGESIRGMAISMYLATKGDLDIPWEEIDASVESQLAGLRQSLAEAARGTLALTYSELTDAELETYLDFLRSPAARKFHAVASVTIGAVIRDTMFTLGEDMARRLQRVDI